MTIHGYELTSEWENSTCGKIANAAKGGKRYFLKRYQTPVAPMNNGTLDAKTFAHNKKLFEDFVALRKRVNTSVRALAGPGGNIVIPVDEFIDGNTYVEASEFVEGAVSRDELAPILMSLSLDTKKLLMKTAAGALSSIHSKRIVHSDLKLENLLLVRNSAGNYVAKLLDFDSSYPVDQKPDEIIGTIDYYSPELGAYVDAEDDREEMEKHITEKTDIFSLGLIYHFYLAGEFPEALTLTDRLKKRKDKGKVIYPWVVLNSGCELKISPKVGGAKYVSLISDMLSLDPKDRPTASEVLKRLQTPDEGTVVEEPWPEHGIVLNKAKIESAGIIMLEKAIVASENRYRVMFSDGKKQTMTKEELISGGFAKPAAPGGFCSPWREHGIVFDVERIKSRGFTASEQTTVSGIKGYSFYRADGTSTFFKVEMLVAMKYANKTASPTGGRFDLSRYSGLSFGGGEKDSSAGSGATAGKEDTSAAAAEPWPEHKVVFDTDVIKAKGYVGFARKTMGGVNGYEFIRSGGARQFLRIEMVLIQKMAKKL